MNVSVIICTWNRAALLDRTLAEMRQLRVPAGVEWELLVVNNNSTDATDEVIARHRSALPVRRLFQPLAGKSHACNLALQEARGDLLVWTDDDVLVDPGWLAAYLDAADRYPGAAFFAGAIDPWFETDPPAWVRRHLAALGGVYAVADYGPDPRPLDLNDGVFGANMASRAAVARQFPLNPDLGRIGKQLIGADDTELVLRLTAAGHAGYWLPTARVRHFIPSGRLTIDYVRRWYHDSGIALVRRQGGVRGPMFFGAPRWAVRRYLAAAARAAVLRPWKGDAWLRSFIDSNRLRGLIREARAATARPDADRTLAAQPESR
jgi:glycosyltransferase involved in cell wall biosynthesis